MKRPKSVARSGLKLRTIETASGPSIPTPLVSRWPSTSTSAYPSEDEREEVATVKPFKFLELPSELRNKIYGYIFEEVPGTIDLDPNNYRLVYRHLAIFFVSKQVHAEVSHAFYSTHAVRLFPCYPGRFFKSPKPLLRRLPPRYRASLTSLELRLGPGWGDPPKGWTVNKELGLSDCLSLRILKVMVQVDPSSAFYTGFRNRDDGFYETFCANLLEKVLAAVPSVVEVEFDGYPSVGRHCPMMRGLLQIARRYGKMISWGPESGWKEEADNEWKEALLASAIGDLTMSAVSAAAA